MEKEIPDLNALRPKFVFGLTNGLCSNCFFLDEDKIIYHVAGVFVIHDVSNNSQEFVYLNKPEIAITTMDLSNSKNLMAVAEKDKIPSVSIYNLTKSKHIRQLTPLVDLNANSFIQIKFSWDDLYIAALTGPPDYTMYYFNWKMSKVDSYLQVVRPPNLAGPVNDMALNPSNSGLCCFVGNGLFRLMSMGDLVWKQFGFHNAKKYDFTTVCWLDDEKILAGTVDGRLFLINRGELKAVYNVQSITDFDPNASMANPYDVRPMSGEWRMEITHFTPVKQGLMFVMNGHQVYYFKMNADQKYRQRTIFLLERDKRLEKIEKDKRLHVINTLCVSPKNTRLVCVTKRSQLFWSSIAGKSFKTEVLIEPFGETLHHGGVCGLSVGVWNSVFVTCGTVDRTVKMWNYAKYTLLLTQEYDEDVLDVSLHPTGLYVLVGFANKVLFGVTLNGVLTTRRALPVDRCRMTRFSASGHMFAVVDDMAIDVYCSVTFVKRFELQGHKNTITDLVWASNDWKLYSSDIDGRICQFNLYSGEHIIKYKYFNQYILGLTVSNNLKDIYTVAQDGRIREIYNQTVIRDKHLEHGSLNAVLNSASNPMLFIACENGVILSLLLPITTEVKYKEFYIHNAKISKMRLTIDDSTLITSSEDGSICIWDVKNANEKFLNANTTLSEDILVSSKYLKNRIDTVTELNLKLEDLMKQRALDINTLTKSYEKRIEDINSQFSIKIKRLQKEKQEMVALHEDDKARTDNKIIVMKEEHELESKNLKNSYNERLDYEDYRYAQLKSNMTLTEEKLKKETEMCIMLHEKKIKELTEKFNEEIKNKEDYFKKFKEQLDEEKKLINREITEFDDQKDRELLELRATFEAKIYKWSKNIAKTQKEVNFYKAKSKTAKKEEDELRFLVDKYHEDIKKLKNNQKVLDEKVMAKEKELQKCNAIAKEKDDWMVNEEMKINSIKKQIEVYECDRDEKQKAIDPLKRRLNNLQLTVEDMNLFMIDTKKEMETIKFNCNKLQDYIRSTTKELKKIKKFAFLQNAFIKDITIDIHYIFMRSDNEALLKDSVKELYHKFTNTDLSAGVLKSDLFRQRTFLEKCLNHLRMRYSTALKKVPSHKKIIKENNYLIETINKLRREVEINRTKYKELECVKNCIKKNKSLLQRNRNPAAEELAK